MDFDKICKKLAADPEIVAFLQSENLTDHAKFEEVFRREIEIELEMARFRKACHRIKYYFSLENKNE